MLVYLITILSEFSEQSNCGSELRLYASSRIAVRIFHIHNLCLISQPIFPYLYQSYASQCETTTYLLVVCIFFSVK